MQLDWKLLVLIGAVSVFCFLTYNQVVVNSGDYYGESFYPVSNHQFEEAVCNNPDDAADKIISDSLEEMTTFSEEDTESLSAINDSQDLDDLGNSYNENDF